MRDPELTILCSTRAVDKFSKTFRLVLLFKFCHLLKEQNLKLLKLNNVFYILIHTYFLTNNIIIDKFYNVNNMYLSTF